MSVTRLEIRTWKPYEDGATFGETGSYERLDGLIHFAVNPEHTANRLIVDLDKAARDADGLVHFSADFCLIQPVDPARGNRRLLFDVANRGRKTLSGAFNRAAPVPVPTERLDPGDGFLMRRGWTLAWCGWQWDVNRTPALLGLEAPRALGPDGREIAGQVAVTIQTGVPVADSLLADRIHQPYPAADVEQPDALLTVRDYPDAPRVAIERSRWRFARDENGQPVQDDTRIWLKGGFEPGRIYEVVYRTCICPVVGSGLLAVRDTVAHLRGAAAGNPCAGRIEHTFGYGVSQSGRFLRHFLSLGLNLDEGGQAVFDGLFIHVAGARRGEFNHRYAQPSVQYTPSFGHLPPHGWDEQTDPETGITDGLLRRQRLFGGIPRIIATNSSAEYWRGDGSLLHTDPAGTRDVEPPPEARVYAFASTQHTSGALPLTNDNPLMGIKGAHPFSAVDFSPLMRAALDNLDRWVTAGEEPPPSVFPRLADGTALPREAVIAAFARVPGAVLPRAERLRPLRRLDLGPEVGAGVGRFPAAEGERYPTFVSAVDPDGNETGGIRLPAVAVPLASFTGWNPRHADCGGEGQIVDMLGSTLPLPQTTADRQRTGDPRPAIGERYRDRDDYLTRVRAAAEALAAERYILAEDIEGIEHNAGRLWDALAPATVTEPAEN